MAQLPVKRLPVVGYVVSRWPRLSQTFVLGEILALEQQGVVIRIFPIKERVNEPAHARVNDVHADVHRLYGNDCRWARAGSHLRILGRHPIRYFRALASAVQMRRWDAFRRFHQACYLTSLLSAYPVDCLHAHFSTAPTSVAMFTHLLAGLPFTFTAHARDIFVDTSVPELRQKVQHASRIVTVSEYNRKYLASRVDPEGADKISLVYNGLDHSGVGGCSRHEAFGRLPVILSVGRLVEKKGFSDLIAAVAMLVRREHGFRLEIIGDGPLRATLQRQVEDAGLSKCVTLAGAQPQEYVQARFDRASLFVLPCVCARDGDRDGIPMVLFEAMARGVPVISTWISGIPEAIEDERQGLLVAPNDPKALADAMERLLVDPASCSRLAGEAKVKVAEQFDIAKNTTKLLNLFSSDWKRDDSYSFRETRASQLTLKRAAGKHASLAVHKSHVSPRAAGVTNTGAARV